MKKHLYVQIVLWIVWCVLPTASRAQFDYSPCEACVGGPLEKIYGPPTTLQEAVGGCIVEITYQKRYCDYTFDLKIQKVRIVSGNCSYPLDQLIGVAIGRMVFNNSMAFPPHQNKEGAVWRLTKPRCWKYSGQLCTEPNGDLPGGNPPAGSNQELIACDTTQCCVNMMHAYRNECGDLQIRDMNVEMFLNPEFHQQYIPVCRCAEMPGQPKPAACVFQCYRRFIENYLREEAEFGY